MKSIDRKLISICNELFAYGHFYKEGKKSKYSIKTAISKIKRIMKTEDKKAFKAGCEWTRMVGK